MLNAVSKRKKSTVWSQWYVKSKKIKQDKKKIQKKTLVVDRGRELGVCGVGKRGKEVKRYKLPDIK